MYAAIIWVAKEGFAASLIMAAQETSRKEVHLL